MLREAGDIELGALVTQLHIYWLRFWSSGVTLLPGGTPIIDAWMQSAEQHDWTGHSIDAELRIDEKICTRPFGFSHRYRRDHFLYRKPPRAGTTLDHNDIHASR